MEIGSRTTVMLFDQEGRVTWCSDYKYSQPCDVLGKFAWQFHSDEQIQCAIQQKFVDCRETGESQSYRAVSEIAGKFHEFDTRVYRVGIDGIGFCGFVTELCYELSLLSNKEQEVMRLLAKGLEVKVIADEMNVTVSTAHTYLRRIRSKLKVEGHAELIVFAIKSGAVE